jgi:hypothetical protein
MDVQKDSVHARHTTVSKEHYSHQGTLQPARHTTAIKAQNCQQDTLQPSRHRTASKIQATKESVLQSKEAKLQPHIDLVRSHMSRNAELQSAIPNAKIGVKLLSMM